MVENEMTEQEELELQIEGVKNLRIKEWIKTLAGLVAGGVSTGWAVSEIERGVIYSDGESRALAGGLIAVAAGAFFYSGARFTDACRLNDEEKRLKKVANENRNR